LAGDNLPDADIESCAAQPSASVRVQTDWPAVAARKTGEFPMEVILKEDVANLGHRGDVVKVADGYGRNFLLPRKLALQATLANKAVIEQMKTAAARRSATEKTQAEELVAKLGPMVLSFTRKSGENGQLFGSVTSVDIAAALEAKGFEVDRRKIQLAEPLKALGNYDVAIKLHREVTAHVKVKVLGDAAEEMPATQPVAEAAIAE
jgi:large subunit ribosomal protein L9